MSAVIVIQQRGIGGGTDVTPDAVNWGNITKTGQTGWENNSASAQTITGIDTVITLKASWTSTASSNKAKGYWVKNGAGAGAPVLTPAYVTAVSGDVLYFIVTDGYANPAGSADNGTVTVTNESDGGASLDTFTYSVQFVPGGGGGGGGSGGSPGPPEYPSY